MATIRAVNARIAALAALTLALGPRDADWPVNGGRDNIRYSPLNQLNRKNVDRLQVAWTYDSHDAFTDSEMQSNPIVVDGALYATTPTLKVVAIDASSGKEIWKFDPGGGAGPRTRFRHRGVTVPQRSRLRHLPQLPVGARQADRAACRIIWRERTDRPA